LAKITRFVATMNQENVDFVIELGDLVDRVVDGKDPVENFTEVDMIFTHFDALHYHVIGNHKFDSLGRADLLSLIENTGIPAGETGYSFDSHGLHCIVLDAGYTVAEPHEAFDRIRVGEIAWWDWTDAWIPQAELDWLATDLTASELPTVVFTHQALFWDPSGEEADGDDFGIKNAAAVRSLLETDGDVVAVFSEHDHRGRIAIQNQIPYIGLVGNVGLGHDWTDVSPPNGSDPVEDNPFALVEIGAPQTDPIDGEPTYRLELTGYAQQESWMGLVPVRTP
jgi:alkaline phosphatase